MSVTLEERREQKREWARKNYADKRETERARCRSAKRRQRRGEAPRAVRPRYDAESYVEEWAYLTWAGRRSDSIIAGSAPCADWFSEHVLPNVSRSICASCEGLFDPQRAGSLTRCSKTCGMV